jgi:SAM-dependent methyltransferase
MTAAVDPSNVVQESAWEGAEGHYWAEHADLLEGMPARYDPALLDAAEIGAAARVLDVGCGTGSITRAAAHRAGAGTALGVDLSTAMVDVARERAARAGLANAAFVRADAQVHPFPTGGFDVVVSRTGASFFGDPAAAFANLARATVPGGRLALVSWQSLAHNEWIAAIGGALAGCPLPGPPPGAPSPFALAEPERVDGLLRAAGFTDVSIHDVREPVLFGQDPVAACNLMAGLLSWLLDGREAAEQERARAALLTTMRAHAGPEGVAFDSAAWLVTARRGPAGPSGVVA